MFTVRECDLISNTVTSHDSAPIRGRPTLKDAERFHLYSPSELTLYRASCCFLNCTRNHTNEQLVTEDEMITSSYFSSREAADVNKIYFTSYLQV